MTNRFAAEGWQIVPAETLGEIESVPKSGGVLLCCIENAADIERIHFEMDRRSMRMPTISCSESAEPGLIVKSMRAGAHGHLKLPFEIADFAEALVDAEAFMQDYVVQLRIRDEARERLAALSRRERDVLRALAELGSNKKIALALDLSPRTVEIYRSKIMQRLGVEHVAQALWIAFQSGEVSLQSLPRTTD